MSPRSHRPARQARGRLVGATHARVAPLAILSCAALGGCVANSSNPLVTIRAARCDEQQAWFDLELANPGGRNLTVTRLDYEVSHGESSFPVANGAWSGSLELPAHGDATLELRTTFDVPPIEPESTLLHLSGELSFTDQTGYLGLSDMDLTRTPFHAEIQAKRGVP